MLNFKRKQNRLKDFDYNSNGAYFITFCVGNRHTCLSDVKDEKIINTIYGEILNKYLEDFKIRYKHIMLCENVIMPNHVHLILFRTTAESNIDIPRYIGALKTLSCRDIRKSGFSDFQWQKSYYDRIIRSDLEFYNIANYINNNPSRWSDDIENPEHKKKSDNTDYYERIFNVEAGLTATRSGRLDCQNKVVDVKPSST
jgi:putative transposase